MLNKPSNDSATKEKLTWSLVFSLILHTIFFVFLFYRSDLPKKPNYVKAELWSSLPPELPSQILEQNKSSTNTDFDGSTKFVKKDINNKIQDNNDISIEEKTKKEKLAKEKAKKERLAKEKLAKEKLAKEKAKKERLAKEKLAKEKKLLIAKQRESELERLKKSLSGLDINAKKNDVGPDSRKQAGILDGSDSGTKVGELSNYSERIRSSIRRKIVFDIGKTNKNPQVVFEVLRTINGLEKIKKIRSSGNQRWDTAVADAIKRSVPLPDPNQKEILAIPGKLLPNSLELSFRPRE